MKKKIFIFQILFFFSSISFASTSFSFDPDSLCDLIVFKNGDEVQAKVLEITPIEIKYKRCSLTDGPLYIIKKFDVFMIKYANGTKEVIKGENPMSDNADGKAEAKKTKEEQEHARQCDANRKWAHRIFIPIGAIIAALYIIGIVSFY